MIGGVQPDQMALQTPCSEWDVAALPAHAIGVGSNIGSSVAAGSPPEAPPNEVDLAANIAAQFRIQADATLAAWQRPGLDGEANIGAGPMPKQAVISVNLLDTAMHSWDVARATGQPEELPAELAEMILGICQGFVTDDVQHDGGFDPAVSIPADASPTHQLAAFLGRQP